METARLMGGEPVRTRGCWSWNWGEWQGRSLADLRADPQSDMADREAEGLDFQPPGGESYRMVQRRLLPFLHDRRADGEPAVIVCHKGVITALICACRRLDDDRPPTGKAARRLLP